MLKKVLDIKISQGVLFVTTILDSYKPGTLQQLNYTEAGSTSSYVFLVRFKGNEYILKTINCDAKDTIKIESARKEYQLSLEMAKENNHIAWPIDIKRATNWRYNEHRNII